MASTSICAFFLIAFVIVVDRTFAENNKAYIDLRLGSDFNHSSTVVTIGDTVRLHCPAAGYPRPYVTWKKDNQTLEWGSERNQGARRTQLTIRNVQTSDTGLYTCTATYGFGIVQGSGRLNVISGIDYQPTPDYLTNYTSVNSTDAGSSERSAGSNFIRQVLDKYGLDMTLAIACISIGSMVLIVVVIRLVVMRRDLGSISCSTKIVDQHTMYFEPTYAHVLPRRGLPPYIPAPPVTAPADLSLATSTASDVTSAPTVTVPIPTIVVTTTRQQRFLVSNVLRMGLLDSKNFV